MSKMKQQSIDSNPPDLIGRLPISGVTSRTPARGKKSPAEIKFLPISPYFSRYSLISPDIAFKNLFFVANSTSQTPEIRQFPSQFLLNSPNFAKIKDLPISRFSKLEFLQKGIKFSNFLKNYHSHRISHPSCCLTTKFQLSTLISSLDMSC